MLSHWMWFLSRSAVSQQNFFPPFGHLSLGYVEEHPQAFFLESIIKGGRYSLQTLHQLAQQFLLPALHSYNKSFRSTYHQSTSSPSPSFVELSTSFCCPTRLINNATMAAIAETQAILNRALRPVFTSMKRALGPEDAKKSIVSVAGGMYMQHRNIRPTKVSPQQSSTTILIWITHSISSSGC